MNSLPTISEMSQMEQDAIWELIKEVDPDMWLIKAALLSYKVNPQLVPRIIRAIANIAWGTGYGKVQIFLEDRVVSSIKPEENDLINQSALIINKKT